MEPIYSSNSQTGDQTSLVKRWTALNETGQEIGRFAALAAEVTSSDLADFPEAIHAAGGARLTLANETISDIDAMLQPGLMALRAIAARGQDTTVPALALWREFHASRSALLAMAPNRQSLEEPVTA